MTGNSTPPSTNIFLFEYAVFKYCVESSKFSVHFLFSFQEQNAVILPEIVSISAPPPSIPALYRNPGYVARQQDRSLDSASQKGPGEPFIL
jgi:hypothetical protein